MKKIAIIGTFLLGLLAAYLSKVQSEFTIFGKAIGVGRRMSTRYVEPYFLTMGYNISLFVPKHFKNLFSHSLIVVCLNDGTLNM
jgi:predicted NAD/FAD-dependent oxidoreductase